MPKIRGIRALAVSLVALVVGALSLATPAQADEGEVTILMPSSCLNSRLIIKNNTAETYEFKVYVDGVLLGDDVWREAPPSPPDTVVYLPDPAGQNVVVKSPDGAAGTTTDFEQTLNYPGWCGTIPVDFTHTCDGVTVEVANNDDAAETVESIRIYRNYGTLTQTELHFGELAEGATFAQTFTEVEIGDAVSVELTITGGPIDIIGEYEYLRKPKGCGPHFPAEVEDTCDGVEVTATNDSDEPINVRLLKIVGEVSPIIVLGEFGVPAGETKSQVFDLPAGTKFLVNLEDPNKTLVEPRTFHRPDDCGGLPVTGTSTQTIVLSGLAVLAIGAVLLFLTQWARRRRLSQDEN